MVGKKEGKYLVFYLDDNSTIKYDLSTGDQIGIRGKPVKSVNHKTKDYTIEDFINSIEDETYSRFLSYVRSRHQKINGSYLTSFATVLKHAREYSFCEQIFSSGIEQIKGPPPKTPTYIFPGIIKFCKKYNVPYSMMLAAGDKSEKSFSVKSISKCSPCDEFDFNKGFDLAYARAFLKWVNKRIAMPAKEKEF